MFKKNLVLWVLLGLALGLATIGEADEKSFYATVIDIQDAKTKVSKLELYWETSEYVPFSMRSSIEKHRGTYIPISKGEALLEVNFIDIKKVEIGQQEKDQERSIKVTLLNEGILDGYLVKNKSLIGKMEGVIEYKIPLEKVKTITFDYSKNAKKCSKDKSHVYYEESWEYCPICGAKLIGETEAKENKDTEKTKQ